MDRDKLKEASEALRSALERLAPSEPDADLCLRELSPLFRHIADAPVVTPYSNVPCGYYFHEGSLREYEELEKAYSRFSVLARGLDEEEVKASLRK